MKRSVPKLLILQFFPRPQIARPQIAINVRSCVLRRVRIFLMSLILFVFVQNVVYAFEQTDVSEFVSEIKNYANDAFPEFSDENWLNNVLSRRYSN